MSSPHHPGAPQHIPVLGPGHTYASITDKISNIVLHFKAPIRWFMGFTLGFLMLQGLLLAIYMLLFVGVGVWGINIPVGWGFDIINFVWWIGIGHAGTLISAILLLFRQQWRTSINRAAEAMTLFAVACALLFPIFHTGRPWLAAYWLLPYPSTMGVWPQFRSPLIWDVFAVSTYGTVSALFWFTGLIPDLATLRDKAKQRVRPADLRHPGAGMARLGEALADLRDRVSHPRRALHAARAVGAHRRELRLRRLAPAGVARDDLPAVLRRRRHLLGVRDGADAAHPDAQHLRPAGHDHPPPPGQHGEGDAADRPDRVLRLHDGGVLRLVQRDRVREVHDLQPDDGPGTGTCTGR